MKENRLSWFQTTNYFLIPSGNWLLLGTFDEGKI